LSSCRRFSVISVGPTVVINCTTNFRVRTIILTVLAPVRAKEPASAVRVSVVIGFRANKVVRDKTIFSAALIKICVSISVCVPR